MSLPELQDRRFIHSAVKLYLKESPNEFTMDEIDYQAPYTIVSTPGTPFSRIVYYNGFVMLKDKYSPVKLQLPLKQIYDWFDWRNQKFLRARYNYITKFDIDSTRADDLSKPDLKAILLSEHKSAAKKDV